MEKVLDFPRNSSNSCGLACRVGVRVTGWLRMAVCPREELVGAGEGPDAIENLKEPAGKTSLLSPTSEKSLSLPSL